MTYSAFIGVPALEKREDGEKYKKKEREELQWAAMQRALEHWKNDRQVDPYPYPFKDPDKLWKNLKQRKINRGKVPEKVLNEYGKSQGLVFLREKPEEYAETDTRTKSAVTGVYCYSTQNPDGMYDSYNFPITEAWNGISAESSRLVNRNFGTYSDMLCVNEIDWWDSTLLPEIGFMQYIDEKTGDEKYDMIEVDDGMGQTEWSQRLYDFFFHRLGIYGMIAVIECTVD